MNYGLGFSLLPFFPFLLRSSTTAIHAILGKPSPTPSSMVRDTLPTLSSLSSSSKPGYLFSRRRFRNHRPNHQPPANPR